MSEALFVVGDVREVLAAIPDGSIDLVLTSPPFLALRSYLPTDHPDKGKEIGSEASPADFLDTLLDLTVEWRRVLAPHGSLCVELGDTYAGSGGAGGDYSLGGLREGQDKFEGSGYTARQGTKYPKVERDGAGLPGGGITNLHGKVQGSGDGWPLPKSLCGIPELYRLSLAYGRNMLRPERLIEPWRVRNVIRWCRPNPPVGALGDKFRPATSEMVVACTSGQRWFDLDAVREDYNPSTIANNRRAVREGRLTEQRKASRDERPAMNTWALTHAGAPPLDWWQVSTEPFAGAHYATWPRALLTRPIQAMCPREVCTVCGEPRRRITERTQLHNGNERTDPHDLYTRTRGEDQPRGDFGPQPDYVQTSGAPSYSVAVETLGWSDCGHNSWRPGIVLDPFAGSGTTLAVATGHGRNAIGIDLDARNLELARARVGMWLTEVSLSELGSRVA